MDTSAGVVVYATLVNAVSAEASMEQEMQQEITALKRLNDRLYVENRHAFSVTNERLGENRALWQMNYELKRLNVELYVENSKTWNESNKQLEEIYELEDRVKSLSGRNATLERRIAAMDAAAAYAASIAAEATRKVEEKAVKKAAKWKERMERKMVVVITD